MKNKKKVKLPIEQGDDGSADIRGKKSHKQREQEVRHDPSLVSLPAEQETKKRHKKKCRDLKPVQAREAADGDAEADLSSKRHTHCTGEYWDPREPELWFGEKDTERLDQEQLDAAPYGKKEKKKKRKDKERKENDMVTYETEEHLDDTEPTKKKKKKYKNEDVTVQESQEEGSRTYFLDLPEASAKKCKKKDRIIHEGNSAFDGDVVDATVREQNKHSRKDTAVDTMKGDSDLCADEADLPRKKKKKHRHKDVTMRESQENLDLISTHDSVETKKKKHRNKSQAAYRAHEESDLVPDLDLATRKQKNHRNSKATVDTIDQCLNAVSDVQDCAPRKKKKHKDRHSAADMTQEDVGLEGETDPPTQKKKKQKEKGPNIDAVQNDHHIVAGSINLSTKKRKKHREKERATYTAQESLDGLESNVANSTMRKKNRPNVEESFSQPEDSGCDSNQTLKSAKKEILRYNSVSQEADGYLGLSARVDGSDRLKTRKKKKSGHRGACEEGESVCQPDSPLDPEMCTTKSSREKKLNVKSAFDDQTSHGHDDEETSKKEKKHKHKKLCKEVLAQDSGLENTESASDAANAAVKNRRKKHRSIFADEFVEAKDPRLGVDIAVEQEQEVTKRKKHRHGGTPDMTSLKKDELHNCDVDADVHILKQKKKCKSRGKSGENIGSEVVAEAPIMSSSTKKKKRLVPSEEQLAVGDYAGANYTERQAPKKPKQNKKETSADEGQSLLRSIIEERDCEGVPKKRKHKHFRKDVAVEEIVEFDLESGGDPDSSRQQERKKKPSTSHNLRQGDDRVQPSADEDQNLLRNNTEERDCEEVPKKSKHKHCRKDVALEEIVEFDLESGGDPDSSRRRERKKKPSTSHNLRQGDDRVQPSADEGQSLLRSNIEERDCEEVPKKRKHKHCRKDVALEEIVEFDLESGGDPDSSRQRERKKKPSTSHNLKQGDDRVQPSSKGKHKSKDMSDFRPEFLSEMNDASTQEGVGVVTRSKADQNRELSPPVFEEENSHSDSDGLAPQAAGTVGASKASEQNLPTRTGDAPSSCFGVSVPDADGKSLQPQQRSVCAVAQSTSSGNFIETSNFDAETVERDVNNPDESRWDPDRSPRRIKMEIKEEPTKRREASDDSERDSPTFREERDSGPPVDEDFKDYVLNRDRIPAIHKCLYKMNEETRKDYEEQTGIKIQDGRFTYVEDEILRRNYRNIAKYYNLRHPHMLVGLQGEESREDCKAERAFMKKEGMLHLLGKGLEHRTLKHCYYRGRALFDPSRKVEKRDALVGRLSVASDIGKYFHRRLTAEEEDKLFELYATLGPQWMEIGRRMGKYAATVRAAVRNNKMKEKFIGKWSKNEVALLEEAIRAQVGDDLEDISKVCWKKVASHVGTRTVAQCKHRWYVTQRMRPAKEKKLRHKWNDNNSVHLIHV
ncbi:uncharacterized protein ISCGN_027379 [Ixodes scapularis]